MDLEKQFLNKEKKITERVIENIRRYDDHECKKRLEARYIRLRDSNEMMFGGPNAQKATFKSKVAFPIVKQRAILRAAILGQNFRGDPLISVLKAAGSTAENAKNAQDTLANNLRISKFRDKCFRVIKTSAAKYGSAVAWSAYRHTEKRGYKTQQTEYGIDRVFGLINETMMVINYPTHILNYIQDPDIIFPENSTYRGIRERINLSTLISRWKQNPESYVDENIKAVVKGLKRDYDKHRSSDDGYYKQINDPGDYAVNITYMYDKVHIQGNEDNDNYYYLEIVGNKIIRIQHNPNDYDMVPISIFNYYPSDNFWWGNADSEFVLPHENFINMIMGMKADNAINAMQQYIFYGKGTVDKSDWDNRFSSGGFIGVDLKGDMDIRNLLRLEQFPDQSLQTSDSIIREVNSSMQDMDSRPNFGGRQAKTNPMQNVTATATNALEEKGDVIESTILETFQFGLKELAEIDIKIIQQRFPDAFKISPEPQESDRVLRKEEIFGEFGYKTKTALTRNRTAELARAQNFLTGLMNFRGSQDPEWMRINLEPYIRYFLEMGGNDMVEVDETYPVQPEGAPGYVPSAPQLNAQQGAAQPVGPEQQPAGAVNV